MGNTGGGGGEKQNYCWREAKINEERGIINVSKKKKCSISGRKLSSRRRRTYTPGALR